MFGWSQREQAFESGFEAAMEKMAERESNVSAKERALKKNEIDIEAKNMRYETLNEVHDELQVQENQAKFNLTTAKFDIDKHNFELEKTALAKDKAQLQITLDQAKANYEAKVEVALMEQSVEHDKATTELYTRVAKAEAKVDAKDIVIASKDGEILRLDELLKVTMGKLTQIDIKGLTIHVENSKEVRKEDKE